MAKQAQDLASGWNGASSPDDRRPVEELQEGKLSGWVYYGQEAGITIPAPRANQTFKEITAGLIGRVISKTLWTRRGRQTRGAIYAKRRRSFKAWTAARSGTSLREFPEVVAAYLSDVAEQGGVHNGLVG